MNHENWLELPRLSIVITERCTLRCKLCAEYSPYYKPQPHYTFEQIKRFIDEIFVLADNVGDLSFSGGEPLLHNDLWKIVGYCDKYIHQVKRLLILTNGTILPDKLQLLTLKEQYPQVWEKIRFHISDYGPKLSARTADIQDLCKELDIDCRIICYHGDNMFHNGWIDYGDHSKKYKTEYEVRTHAQKCAFRRDIFFVVSSCRYLSRCNRATYRKHLGILSQDTTDIFDVFSDMSREEKRARILQLKEAKYSDSCAYCNGMCEDSPRFPPAEQIL